MFESKLLRLIFFLLIIDAIWLGGIAKNFYGEAIKNTVGGNGNFRIYSAVIVYCLLVIGIYIFVLPKISKQDALKDAILWGGLFGLIVYGIFDFTNHAIFPGWGLKVSIVDMIWGGFVTTLAAYLTTITSP